MPKELRRCGTNTCWVIHADLPSCSIVERSPLIGALHSGKGRQIEFKSDLLEASWVKAASSQDHAASVWLPIWSTVKLLRPICAVLFQLLQTICKPARSELVRCARISMATSSGNWCSICIAKVWGQLQQFAHSHAYLAHPLCTHI